MNGEGKAPVTAKTTTPSSFLRVARRVDAHDRRLCTGEAFDAGELHAKHPRFPGFTGAWRRQVVWQRSDAAHGPGERSRIVTKSREGGALSAPEAIQGPSGMPVANRPLLI
jgi:hypothetical protein